MKTTFTNDELGEIYMALEEMADSAHYEWRDSKPGKERAAALRYKKKIARLMEKIDRILKEKNS